MNTYTTTGLDRLYQAVQHHAEMEFMEAIRREYPDMSQLEEAEMLNKYHELQARAEQRIIAMATVQSREK